MKIILFALVIIINIAICGAQIVGSIAGKVTDAETKLPLSGANVTIRGTFIGTASDDAGEFRLLRIAPGTYTVVVSMLGYHRVAVDEVKVNAGEESRIDVALKPTIIQTEQIVVTASRREQSLQEVPVSISTVTAQTLVDRNSITLDDALRYVPGVNFTQDQVNIRGSSGYSRGVGSRVLLLLDGAPYLTGDTGEISWEVIPVHQIERIEVVKGAGSALYGSSALGGVINVITKEATEGSEFRFRLFSGMYDNPRYKEWKWSPKRRFNSGILGTYGSRSGPLSYIVSLGRTVDESYRENDAYHRWNFYSKTKYDLSTYRSLSLSTNYLTRTHGNFFWWKSRREALRPDDEQRNGKVASNRGNVTATYKEFLSDKLFYTVRFQYFGNFWRDDSLGRVNNVSASHLFHADAVATYELGTENFLTIGGSANYDVVHSNLFEVLGIKKAAPKGAGGALYVQDELRYGRAARLTVGLRYDNQKVSALAASSEISPKLGFTYNLSDATTVRASYGAGFRYPSIAEIFTETSVGIAALRPNLNIRSERSQSYEVGGTHRFGEFVVFDAALFHTELQNLIEAGIYRDSVGYFVTFDNVVKARIDGGEIGLKTYWFGGAIWTDLGYTYIWARDQLRKTALKFRPRHLLHTSVGATAELFRAAMDFRYISRPETIDENLAGFVTHYDARVSIKVVDLRASYMLSDFGLPMQVGLNIRNIFNYHYVEVSGNLAPVRTFFLSIEGVL